MIKQPKQVCYQCGSRLVKVTSVTEFPEHTQSSTKRISYRCSNKECQARIDAKMADMTKQRIDREEREVAKALLVNEARAKAREAKLLIASKLIVTASKTSKTTKKTT